MKLNSIKMWYKYEAWPETIITLSETEELLAEKNGYIQNEIPMEIISSVREQSEDWLQEQFILHLAGIE